MKRKIVILFCLLFLITGCTVDYTLYVDENSITESVDFVYENTAENKELVNRLKNNKQSAYFDISANEPRYYQIVDKSTDEELRLNYRYKYLDLGQLQNSNVANRCYYNRSVIKQGSYITISTSDAVTCMYKDGVKQIDKIRVKIITDLAVVEENSDYKDKNTYVWEIDDQNFNNKPIYMRLSTIKEKTTNQSKLKIQDEWLMIFCGTAVIMIVIIFFVSIKNKKNNRIK